MSWLEHLGFLTMWVITKANEIWVHGQALIPLLESQGHQLLPQIIHPHIPIITAPSKNTPPYIQTCYTDSHVVPCFLDILTPFRNHSDRFLNRHELRNIHKGMTTSQNTAYTHQINKIDLDHLLDIHILYPISTWPLSIKQIP